ncbi:hypothetical protein K1719_039136 [Acacia pycnantha]|nr:hypothetical protein K1719_039136 [Acacia pycnantha]
MNGGMKIIIKAGMLIFALKNTAVWKCDAEELWPSEEEDDPFLSGEVDYKKDWIVDSGCTAHMTGDVEKLHNLSNVKMFKMTSKGTIPITQVGDTIISFKSSNDKLPLQRVMHVPGR